MNLLGRCLRTLLEEKSTSTPPVNTTNAEITAQIAQVCWQINILSSEPKQIRPAALETALRQMLPATPSAQWTAQATQVILSIGQISQASEQTGTEIGLKTAATELVAALNDEETVLSMSLPDIAHTLYALVLPKELGWIDIPTKNLVTAFLTKLSAELNNPTLPAEKLDMAIQQVAEYLCLTDQILPN
jgi:hypothetical protein